MSRRPLPSRTAATRSPLPSWPRTPLPLPARHPGHRRPRAAATGGPHHRPPAAGRSLPPAGRRRGPAAPWRSAGRCPPPRTAPPDRRLQVRHGIRAGTTVPGPVQFPPGGRRRLHAPGPQPAGCERLVPAATHLPLTEPARCRHPGLQLPDPIRCPWCRAGGAGAAESCPQPPGLLPLGQVPGQPGRERPERGGHVDATQDVAPQQPHDPQPEASERSGQPRQQPGAPTDHRGELGELGLVLAGQRGLGELGIASTSARVGRFDASSVESVGDLHVGSACRAVACTTGAAFAGPGVGAACGLRALTRPGPAAAARQPRPERLLRLTVRGSVSLTRSTASRTASAVSRRPSARRQHPGAAPR